MLVDITQDPGFAEAINASDERLKKALEAIKLMPKKADAKAAYRRAMAIYHAEQALIECGAINLIKKD